MTSSDRLDLLALLVLVFSSGGALAGIVIGHWRTRLGARLALLGALAASTVTVIGALAFWQQPMAEGLLIATLVTDVPGTFPPIVVELYLDRLTVFFLLLTNILAIAVTIYSFAWLEGAWKPHRIAGVYNVFLLAVITLLVINNVYLFLLALESVTLSFGYLVLYRHNRLVEESADKADARELAEASLATKVYWIFSHTGAIFSMTALLVLALLAGGDGFDFDSLRRLAFSQSHQVGSVVFLLAVTGFGIKGGFVGAHPWVPLVHPYSPTTTHALTLGFVIKVVSFYMLIRICFQFLAPAQVWWGCLLLVLAGATALIGVFDAILSRDLKTALANHSVENIGIMLAGVGVALVMLALGPNRSVSALAVAQLGLVASFYHMLNHGVFKGLLYLCTGAIEHRLGTVNMERLGGVIMTMPWTAAAFMIGTIAISGFPPFNGFISEWLTLQALLSGIRPSGQQISANGAAAPTDFASTTLLVPLVLVAVLLALGLAFALTAFAFVKIAGETLLGAPRDPAIASPAVPNDAPWLMRGVFFALAALCLALGILPGLVVRPLSLLAQDLTSPHRDIFGPGWTALTIHLPGSNGRSMGVDPALVMLLAAVPLLLALLIAARNRRASPGNVWIGGATHRPEHMQITGSAFASLVWGRFGRRWASETASTEPGLPWRISLSAGYYIPDHFRRLFTRLTTLLVASARHLSNSIQSGDIRWYLVYLFLAFLALLALSSASG
jgi:hydrogenase-4 component B